MSKISECKVDGVGTIRLGDRVKVQGVHGARSYEATVKDFYLDGTRLAYLGVYGPTGFRTVRPERVQWATSSKEVR